MLKVENISCQKGYNLLFENVSFYPKGGDTIRIIGKNGSGKTSLLKIIAGVNKPHSGKISLFDNPQKTEAYTNEVLYLGHNSLLIPQLSVLENLKFLANLHNYQGNLLDALERIGLKNYEHELCYKLSAGQKRKVILSSLFLSKRKLWLLDEPFTALDTTSVATIEALITNHCNTGGMCILTTHQTSTLNLIEVSL